MPMYCNPRFLVASSTDTNFVVEISFGGLYSWPFLNWLIFGSFLRLVLGIHVFVNFCPSRPRIPPPPTSSFSTHVNSPTETYPAAVIYTTIYRYFRPFCFEFSTLLQPFFVYIRLCACFLEVHEPLMELSTLAWRVTFCLGARRALTCLRLAE